MHNTAPRTIRTPSDKDTAMLSPPALVRLADRSILFVMAAEQEYGPHLQARFTPLIVGVGPVEAAVNTAVGLSALMADGQRPDLVVSLGSAGSRSLEQTRVYQVGSVSYRDMDATALGFAAGQTPFLDLPAVVELPHRIPDLPVARLSTGADIVSGDRYDGIAADMVDMETFAVWRACDRFGLPLIGLRGISDGATELTRFETWTEYLEVIDAKLAAAVDALESALQRGATDPR